MSDFHLIGLELAGEEQMLDQAMRALDEVEESEIAFFSESLAYTPDGSHLAFVRLLERARTQRINIVTTLNLGEELLEDLPGHVADARYNAVVVFTRYGAVHVPQAKATPQPFEGVEPYRRINRVLLDVDGELVTTRFFVCSDLWALTKLQPEALRCDLMVVLANFATGAEEAGTRLIGRALTSGVAESAVHVNAYHNPRRPKETPLAFKVEEVFDATGAVRRLKKWRSTAPLEAEFHIYPDARAESFRQMAELDRGGKIALPKSHKTPKITTGDYPVTIVL